MGKISNLIKYKELMKTNISKEFRGKYKKSFLGLCWSFLNPLLQLLIYVIVFSFILRQQLDNYVCFIIVALMPWTFLASTISQSTACILGSAGLIKKVYFPREILPISVVTNNCISFLISMIIVFGFIFFTGWGFSKAVLLLPVIIIIQYLFVLGLAFLASSLTVYFRDLEHLIAVGLSMLFYFTPIVYAIDFIPSNYLMFFKLNPMFHIVNVYRDLLYYQRVPDLLELGILLVTSIIFCIICYFIFSKLEKRFAEEL